MKRSMYFMFLLLAQEMMMEQIFAQAPNSCDVTDQVVTATPTSICANSSSTINIASTQLGVNYYLRQSPSNIIIAGPVTGTGPAIDLGTGNISSTATYNILAEKDKYSIYLNGNQPGFTVLQNSVLDVTDNFTIEGWIKPDEVTGFGYIFNKDGCYALGIGDSQTKISFNTAATNYSSSFNFITGQWYHIACTYASGMVTFFVNGVSIGNVSAVPSIPTAGNGAHIGSGNGGNSNYFKGNIDNVRIWNSVRTAGEIAANISKYLGSTSNLTLVASWWVIEGTGNAKDYSASAANTNSFDGTWQPVTAEPLCDLELITTPTITVKPLPSVDQPLIQTICNNNPTAPVNFTGSPVANTIYNWTNDSPFMGLAASGTGNIASFIGTNPYTSSITGIIAVTPVANGCNGTTQYCLITVRPTPIVNTVANQVLCAGTATNAINFTGLAGSQYSWTNSAPSIGLAANGNGNIPSFNAINNSPVPVTATITVTPKANNCTGVAKTFTITVKGTSTLPTAIIADKIISCGPATVTLTLDGGVLEPGASWKWYSANCGSVPIGTGTSIIVNTTTTTTYYLRSESACNITACRSITIIITAVPQVILTYSPYKELLPNQSTIILATVAPALPGNIITWYRNNVLVPGANTNTINVGIDDLGDYTARVTVGQGCTNVSSPLQIKETVSDKLWIVPNSNNGRFVVRLYSTAQQLGLFRTMIIYDVKGAKVFEKKFLINAPYNNMDVDIRNRGTGIYIVIVTDNQNKLIISGKVEVVR